MLSSRKPCVRLGFHKTPSSQVHRVCGLGRRDISAIRSIESKTKNQITTRKQMAGPRSHSPHSYPSKEICVPTQRFCSTKSQPPKPRSGLWERVKEEARHYWHGTRLLGYEMKTSAKILWSLRHGQRKMTRRERRQLLRTAADMFRVIPFSIFVIVPFLELTLPLALYFFPNMLPSTFEREDQKSAAATKKLKLKLDLALFIHDTLKQLKTSEADPALLNSIMEKVRRGEHVPLDQILHFSKQFKDELVLDNLSRGQLVAICKFMGVPPYGNEQLLKFLLRQRMRFIKTEDKEIQEEGVHTLTIEELQAALRDRGMRGTSKFRGYLEMRLREWLDLSLNHQIPYTLLIISRTFVITETERPEELLKEALSSLSEETLNDQSADRLTDPLKKLEALRSQQEKIEEERQLEEKTLRQEQEEEQKEKKQKSQEIKEALKKLEVVNQKLKSDKKDDLPPLVAEVNSELVQAAVTKTPRGPEPEKVTQEDISELAETLTSLASDSYVEREKSQIAKLKEKLAESHVVEPVAVGRIIEPPQPVVAPQDSDPTVSRLKKRLDSMVEALEQEVTKVEQALGSKYKVLDLDKDGQITVEELSGVMRLLKDKYTEDEVMEIIAKLDRDGDGKISVDELRLFVEENPDEEQKLISNLSEHSNLHHK